MSMRTNLASSGSQVPQSDMLERSTVGSTAYVVSHEKVLGDINLYMPEHDRKKAIPRSPVARSKMNGLHCMGTCHHIKTQHTVWSEFGGI